MRSFQVAVVGGGASGLTAAISAARAGAGVVICERSSRIGRKVLASGNGRCNLTNDRLDSSFYNPASRKLVDSVFSRFGNDSIKSFFRGIGLLMRSDEGRVFPVTNQAASVLKVLEDELVRLGVKVEKDFEVSDITSPKRAGSFCLSSTSGRSVEASSVVIACGGRSYPALGSDGAGYKLAERIGHKIVKPVPAAVPLTVKDPICHLLQGQKIEAAASCVVNGSVRMKAEGDLLFTRYGLSGTAILDISGAASIAIHREGEGDVQVEADMAPFMTETELESEISSRRSRRPGPADLLTGILPNKFSAAFRSEAQTKDPWRLVSSIKRRTFKVTGTRGWNEADFTSGGVDTASVDASTLASRMMPGVYFSGEVLDVDGRRGGYNLAWAWASGHVAGRMASCAR
jgi:predicted Rossmann fold flavoprotein